MTSTTTEPSTKIQPGIETIGIEGVSHVEVSYDVPVKTRNKLVADPAGMFRCRGVARTQSVFLLPVGLVPWKSMQSLVEQGAHFEVIGVSVADPKALKAYSLRKLEAEAQRIREHLAAKVAVAKARLEHARKLQSVTEVGKALVFANGLYSKATRELKAAEEAAVAFDLTGDVRALFAAVRAEIDASFSAYKADREAANKGCRDLIAEAKKAAEAIQKGEAAASGPFPVPADAAGADTKPEPTPEPTPEEAEEAALADALKAFSEAE